MNEGKRLDSEFPPASDHGEDDAPPAASERRPRVAKYDPEYNVVASAQCFRAHARLLIETAETASLERVALANFLTHVRELLLFTLGWLERGRSEGSVANAAGMIESVREILASTRLSEIAGADEMVALGVCFEQLAVALETV